MNNNYVITPDSDIYLIKSPLEMDSKHQISFANASDQYNYFLTLPKLYMGDATYMRKDGRLYFEGAYDTCLTYNYCMYKNTNYSNKWFYAYVTDIRYESNNSCSCQLKTDVFQTWMFDYTIKKSFCERFMPARQYDTVGRYTYPEDLELGDYVANNYVEIADFKTQNLVVGCTADYTDLDKSVTGIYQGIPTGCGYYYTTKDASGATAVKQWLQDLTDATKESAIVSLFLAPSFLCTSTDVTDIKKVNNSTTAGVLDYTITNSVSGLNGYIPKNNKLYTYPYYFTLVTNGSGGSSIIKPELWDTSSHVYRVYSALTPGCSVIGMPKDYAGRDIAWEESLPLAKYPQLNYSTDQFINWQTQQGLNNTFQKVSGAFGAYSAIGNVQTSGSSLATANLPVVGNIASSLMQVASAIKQEQLAELVPAQFSGNVNCGDVWSSANEITYRFNFMSIRSEFAQRIDEYFEMFGYRVNRVMTINTNTRSNWNFVKTIDVNMTGDIPERDLQELKDLYNGGFTIWHTTTHFMDYSQTNS